jgi:hypothetical protein
MPALGSQHDAAAAEQAIDAVDNAGLTFAGNKWVSRGPCLEMLKASDA